MGHFKADGKTGNSPISGGSRKSTIGNAMRQPRCGDYGEP